MFHRHKPVDHRRREGSCVCMDFLTIVGVIFCWHRIWQGRSVKMKWMWLQLRSTFRNTECHLTSQEMFPRVGSCRDTVSSLPSRSPNCYG
jgi:hypothetical protein